MFDLILSFVYLLVSLFILVRGADMFVDGAKSVGASWGMSSFAIGVLIVGFGTSLPEFASSVVAAIAGVPEIVVANVVGSNITNILLIVGLLAVVGGTITIQKNLLKSELPVFFIATTHFILSLWDGIIDRWEGVLLLGTFGAYLWYLLVEARGEDSLSLKRKGRRPALEIKSFALIAVGLIGLLVGAKYSVDMIGNIAMALAVPIGFVSITVLAIGTSLPELVVSLRASMKKDLELAVGNIFGSNAVNMLVVGGVPALFVTLPADQIVQELGISVLLASSLILFVAALSGRVMRWEGIMMILFFGFFLVKLTTFL